MRKYSTYLITAIFFLLLITQNKSAKAAGGETGIKFRSISFREALAAAKAEHKYVFLHGFAEWCEYCKYMKDSVYTDKEVADYMNATFVCIKMDMEKEGKVMYDSLKAHPFPQLLFFESNGDLMHRGAGRKYKPAFLELAHTALDPKKQIRYYRRKYENGTAQPEEVQLYFRMLEMAGGSAQDFISDYLSKLPDSSFTTQNTWRIICDIIKDPYIPAMKRVIGNKKKLEALYTPDSVNNKLVQLFNTYLMQYVQMLDTAGYEKAKRYILRTNGLDIAPKICAWADLNKLKMKSEWDKYKVESKKFIEQYAADDFRRINDIAAVYYEHYYSDKELMAVTEGWLKHSISIADIYKSNNLLASVSFMLGKKEQALNAANHAIEVAKKNNNDYSQTTQLLNAIQKMQ